MTRQHQARRSPAQPRKGTRPVFFAELGGFVDTPVYDHYALAPGVAVQGPAIVEQRESTVVVGPSGTALDANST